MAVRESQAQIPPDSTGKAIATVTITRPDGTDVYRQEMTLSDAEVDAFRARITPDGNLTVTMIREFDLWLRMAQQLDCIRRSLNTLANTQHRPEAADIFNPQT